MSNVDKKELVSLKAKLKRKAKALDMNLFGVADVERPACDGTCDSAFGKLVPFFIIHRERAIEWLANFAGQPEAVAGVR